MNVIRFFSKSIWPILGALVFYSRVLAASDTVEFTLTYPIVSPKPSISYQSRIYLGLNVSYQLMLNKYLGVALGPSIWGVPIKINGTRRTLSAASFLSGVVLSAFPESYINPRIQLWGGAGLSDAGAAVDSRWIFPVMADLSLVIYRSRSPFQDSSLGLTLLAGVGHYFNQNNQLTEKLVFQTGIGMRGSF